MGTDELVRATLRSVWQLAAETCQPVDDSSVSEWSVTIDGGRYTARITPDIRRAEVVAALLTADVLAAAGLGIGRPVRTVDGALTVATADGDMSLVQDVAGRPLDAEDPLDQQWWGDALGRAHQALLTHQTAVPRRLSLPEAAGAHLAVEPWLRAALADAAESVTRLLVTDQLTYGVLHGDPRAAEFRLDASTGRTGLAAWGVPRVGPLVYDVAVAVRHAGGAAAAEGFIDGYVSAGPVTRDEVAVALPVMLRLHWALVAEEHARALTRVPPQRNAGPNPAGAPTEKTGLTEKNRRDALEEARQVLAALAEADRAE